MDYIRMSDDVLKAIFKPIKDNNVVAEVSFWPASGTSGLILEINNDHIVIGDNINKEVVLLSKVTDITMFDLLGARIADFE